MKMMFGSKARLIRVAFIIFCWGDTAFADWYRCRHCGQEWRDDVVDRQRFYSEWVPLHESECRSQHATLSSASTPDAVILRTLAPILQSAAYELGYQLGAGLFGNAAANAQQTEARRQERMRFEEEARRKAAEDQRRREEIYRRLNKVLKLSGLTQLTLKGFDGDGGGLTHKGVGVPQSNRDNPLGLKLGDSPKAADDLRPQGTAFFGLGGSTKSHPLSEPTNDPMVVDLRNLQRASFFVAAATTVPSADVEFTMDEALKVANGDNSFVGNFPADAAVPIISEDGLIAFQLANIEYARAHEYQIRDTEAFNQARHRRDLAAGIVKLTKTDLEKAESANADEAVLNRKRQMYVDVCAAAQSEEAAWEKARSNFETTEHELDKTRAECMRVLRAVAAGNNLQAYPSREAKAATQSELKELRLEVEGLKTALERLSGSIELDQEQRREWEEETAKASRRAVQMFKEKALGGVLDRTHRTLNDQLKHADGTVQRAVDLLSGETDPGRSKRLDLAISLLDRERNQIREGLGKIQRARDAKRIAQVGNWATSDTEDVEKMLKGIYQLCDMALNDRGVQKVLKIAGTYGQVASNAKTLVDSSYDIAVEVISIKRIRDLNRNSEEYLKAVAHLNEKMSSAINRIKEIEDRLKP